MGTYQCDRTFRGDGLHFSQRTGNKLPGSNQLNIQQIRKAQEGEFDMADYMPSTKKDIDGMFKELLAMISKTKNQYLKQLAEKIFIKDKNCQENSK